jgi:3-hydroxy-3-methylglutaryl CoA synthase
MKRKLFYPFLLIAVTCLAFVSQMDGDPFEALLERMKVFNKTYAQEKVHLHLDKPYYAVGDNIQKYGNTTAASVPIALCEAWEAGKIKEGDLVCLAAFGSGFTWASALIRW